MGDLMIEFQGHMISFVQASRLAARIKELGPDTHWHFNECGCCVTLHGSDCAYLIGRDGGETFFPHRGCNCEHSNG